MITVLPYKTKCKGCGVNLSYDKEDILHKIERYTVYHDIEKANTIKYIVCPVCGYEIKL